MSIEAGRTSWLSLTELLRNGEIVAPYNLQRFEEWPKKLIEALWDSAIKFTYKERWDRIWCANISEQLDIQEITNKFTPLASPARLENPHPFTNAIVDGSQRLRVIAASMFGSFMLMDKGVRKEHTLFFHLNEKVVLRPESKHFKLFVSTRNYRDGYVPVPTIIQWLLKYKSGEYTWNDVLSQAKDYMYNDNDDNYDDYNDFVNINLTKLLNGVVFSDFTQLDYNDMEYDDAVLAFESCNTDNGKKLSIAQIIFNNFKDMYDSETVDKVIEVEFLTHAHRNHLVMLVINLMMDGTYVKDGDVIKNKELIYHCDNSDEIMSFIKDVKELLDSKNVPEFSKFYPKSQGHVHIFQFLWQNRHTEGMGYDRYLKEAILLACNSTRGGQTFYGRFKERIYDEKPTSIQGYYPKP